MTIGVVLQLLKSTENRSWQAKRPCPDLQKVCLNGVRFYRTEET